VSKETYYSVKRDLLYREELLAHPEVTTESEKGREREKQISRNIFFKQLPHALPTLFSLPGREGGREGGREREREKERERERE